jgi:hypothetical protein
MPVPEDFQQFIQKSGVSQRTVVRQPFALFVSFAVKK